MKKIGKRNIRDILALTPMQEGMLYHYLKEPQRNLYFVQLCLEIAGPLEIRCFNAAWNFVVKTNEMLRASFRWEQVKAPLQIVLKESSIELHYHDLSDKADSEKVNVWEELKKQDRKRGFHLKDIPFRITLCKMDDALYQVVISHHHILYDGWSNGIILREFFDVYNELNRGVPLNQLTPPMKTRFKEFVKWIGDYDKDESNKVEEANFWIDYLAGFEGETAIPLKRKKIPNMNDREENQDYYIDLDPGVSRSLFHFASRYNMTPVVLFYSAWGLLLQKICNSDDVIFGTTVSGRSAKIPGIEDIVGLFLNTLPLRIRCQPGESIIDTLGNLNLFLQTRETREHTSLVKINQYTRDNTHEKRFDSIMVVENYPLDIQQFQKSSSVTINSYSIIETSHYDLSVVIRVFDSINIHFLYYSRVFAEDSIKRLGSYFLRLIQAILENPGQDIAGIEILSNREKQQILEDFNNTDVDYPRDKTIHQLFEEQVEQTPDNIALVGPFQMKNWSYTTHTSSMTYISYRQLDEKSNQMAHLLQERGIGPDIVVGIMASRSLEMVMGILAILKAGGAYLPIDPEYPKERIDFMVADSNTKILLTSWEITNLSTPETFKTCPQDTSSHLYLSPALVTSLAYIIYTSGSTGKPKGVMVEHGSMVNLLWALQKQYPLTASDTFLLKTSYMFDVSVAELFGWLIDGGRLAILESNGEKDPKVIIETIERLDVTHINFVPSMFNVFVEGLNPRAINKLCSLKYIFLAGEGLLPGLVKKFRELNASIPLENIYGPTEGTVYSAKYSLSQWDGHGNIPIGKPLQNMKLYILDRDDGLQPLEVPGELYIGGKGISRGYLNKPELTAERFLHVLNRSYMSYIIYQTGDLARWLPDGNIEFLGRIDNQVKIRGFRIELGEIENRLMSHQIIKEAVVVQENENICAYIVCEPSAEKSPDKVSLREYLSQSLPDYMVPAHFRQLEKIPRTPTGKIDRKALISAVTVMKTGREYVSPKNHLEKIIAETWKDLLGLSSVGIYDNFFELGGNSLLVIRLASRLNQILKMKKEIPVVTLFNHPTIASMARYLSRQEGENKVGLQEKPKLEINGKRVGVKIAVIGMACRLPGAKNCEEFCNNLKNGIETIGFFSTGELEEKGVDPGLAADPNYVPAKGWLENNLCFDAFFFGYTPTEAAIMDPQVRTFLECAWEALENAGYDPGTYQGIIGLYAGASPNPFWEVLPLRSVKGNNMYSYSELWDAVQFSDKDYLSTRVAYKLDLKGPVVTLQTACSTSLVAVDQACRGLFTGACDMALAGGVSITLHDESGYLYQEGTIMSPDGHCRAFDAEANGTVSGNGVGVVVLKPIENAMADGDTIFAVIKGCSINNDGKNKAGFTAPSSEGQAKAICGALNKAGVRPESIAYIETHGTGTALGDPIEIEGLKMAWESFEPFAPDNFNKKKYCAIGSVKTNIGHLDAAAGIAGLIKTVLVLYHRSIPPSLNFKRPNPAIDLENSPFYINTKLKSWQGDRDLMRAGVSSFGLGGTNVHVILEEWPIRQGALPKAQSEEHKEHTTWSQGRGGVSPPYPSREYQLIILSAKTQSALDKMTENLTEYFKKNLLNRANPENLTNPGPTLADAAYTLQMGRKAFPHRRMLVCSLIEEAVRKLEANQITDDRVKEEKFTVIFMFSGQGSQYINMGLDLYKNEPMFRQQVDLCFQLLERITGSNMKPVLYPDETEATEAEKKIYLFIYTTPIKFIFEYSLAKLLMAWGIQPDAMIGHSFGEYAAACLSGVFSLEDGLFLAALRGELMHRLPPGAMLSVPLTEEELKPMLDRDDNLSLAAVNEESLCVVSGPVDTIDAFEKQLNEKGHECIRFRVPRAGHSRMVEPIMAEFNQKIRKVVFKKPRIPYVSGMTGTWITAEQAVDPGYWTRHLRETVRFANGLTTLLKEPHPVFLEVGPGRGLTLFVNQHPDKTAKTPTVNMVRHRKESFSDVCYTLTQIGQLWLYGLRIHWQAFHSGQKRQRIPLPVYPFESEYYPVDKNLFRLDAPVASVVEKAPGLQKKEDMAEWFYVPSWERIMLPVTAAAANTTNQQQETSGILVFMDMYDLGIQLKKHLEQEGIDVIAIERGKSFRQENIGGHVNYTLNPYEANSYHDLVKELAKQGELPRQVVHLWGIDPVKRKEPVKQQVDEALALGFYSLLFLVQAWDKHAGDVSQDLRIEVVTSHVHEVTGGEVLCTEKAAIYGLCTVIPQEYPNIFCRCIDIILPPGSGVAVKQVRQLMMELFSGTQDRVTAYRNDYRWVQSFKPLRLENPGPGALVLKPAEVIVITGGTGTIGLVLARHLAESLKAKLILTCRSIFPAREDWDQWLNTHPADDRISRKILKLQEIEAIGGEVLVMPADVSSLQQMQEVFTYAEEKWGAINGVIHSAGIVGEKSYTELKEMGKTGAQLHFQPKIYGLLVLEELLKNRAVDFCLLMSSTSSILGGLGFGAYCAANVFMDTYINHLNRCGRTRWISVNWDGWQLEEQQVQDTPLGSVITQLAMTPEQGVNVFERVLAYEGIKQVVQCTGDLQTRIRQWVELESLKQQVKDEQKTAVTASQSLYQPRPHLSNPYVSPGNPLEQELAEIWKQLLGYDRVGTQDNFFELNGDSLKAVIAISKIHKQLNIKMPLKDFFSDPTIKGLTQYIEGTKESEHFSIEPIEKKEYYRLSSVQQRMFLLNRLERESTAYNIPQVMELKGALNRETFRETFLQLIRRHDTLRTSFLLVKDEPMQRVHDEVEFEIEYYNMKEVENFIRPFDLSQAPLLRVRLEGIEHKYILMLDTHHIISDGTSMGLVVKEFMRLYKGETLSPLAIQYKDYAAWQNAEKDSQRLKSQETYWLKQLEGEVPVMNLPLDFDRPAMWHFEGRQFWFELGAAETNALKVLAMEKQVTLYMVLVSIYTILLAKLTGQEDIIIGAPTAGRSHVDLQNIFGMFINTLVLRHFPIEQKYYAQYLLELKTKIMAAFENQDYPFDKLVEQKAVTREVGRNPLFDAAFVFQNMEIPEMEIPGLKLKPARFEYPSTKLDLSLISEEIGESLRFTFEYGTALFKHETIERFCGYFRKVVSGVLVNPGQKIADIEIITQKEKLQILREFNHTYAPFPGEKTIHQLFAEQVEQTPDHIALEGKIDPKFEIRNTRQIRNPNDQNSKPGGTRGLAPLSVHISITYKELNQSSHQLTQLLIKKGVRPDTIVGIMVECSPGLIIGLLAILKAGGAYLPIDPDYPQERIDYMLADSKVRVLLTTPKLQVKVNDEVKSINLSSALNVASSTLASTSTCQVSPANLAYVIYTSGSTGRPKGVLIRHRGVVNMVMCHWDIFGENPRSRISQVSSLSFDAMTSEVWPCLLAGACLCIVDNETRMHPGKMKELLIRNQVTISFQSTLIAAALLDEQWSGAGEMGTALEVLRTAGDRLMHYPSRSYPFRFYNLYGPTEDTVWTTWAEVPVIKGQVERLKPPLIGKPVANHQVYILSQYSKLQPPGVPGELCISGIGLTRGYLNQPELTANKFCLRWPLALFTTTFQKYAKKTNFFFIPDVFTTSDARLLNGWGCHPLFEKTGPGPLKNFLLEGAKGLTPLLDRKASGKKNSMQSCSPATIQVSPYYSSQYPSTPAPYYPIYRTGDLARWLPDGNIEFLGRIDNQVKIRGFRIELTEIESQLLSHPAIDEALVLSKGNENKKGDKYLCAYIVGKRDFQQTFTSKELREYLTHKLPGYMIPSCITFLEKMPLTANGKIDLKALPPLDTKTTGIYTQPRNEVEERLAELWSFVLEIEKGKIGIDDNFFELGGHSLDATLLVSRIHKELNVKIALSEIFRNSTIRDMFKLIAAAGKEKFIFIWQTEEKEYYALSSAQKRLYVEQHRENENISYNVQAVVRLEGELDAAIMTNTFQQLIKRHEILRTSFLMVNDEPVQRIHKEVHFEMEYYDQEEVEVKVKVENGDTEGTRGLAPLPVEIAERKAQSAERKEERHAPCAVRCASTIKNFIRPFDLSHAPLLRVGLLKVKDREHIVMVDMHHIIVDEVSIKILFKEFMSLYVHKKNNILPGLRLQYKDFSEWQNREKKKESLKKQETYWMNEFINGVPPLKLAVDYKRPEIQVFDGRKISCRLDNEETTALKELALKEDVTLFMLLLALFYILLSKICNQEDIVMGTPISSRNYVGLEQPMGFFLNMLALRNYPTDDKKFLNFLNEVKEKLLKAYENRDYPFEDLVNKVMENRNSGRNSLFDVVFVFRDKEITDLPGIEASGLKLIPYETEIIRSPFDLILHAHEAGKVLDFTFHFKIKLFKEETIWRIMKNLKIVVSTVVKDNDVRLKDIFIPHDLLAAEPGIQEEGEGDFDF